MKILLASLPDIDEIPALRGAMAQEMGHHWDARSPGWRQRFAEYWRNRQRDGNAQIFLAKADDATIGLTIASVADDYRGVTFGDFRGYVNCVYVVPERRSQGIARELMIAAMGWLQGKGCVLVRLRSSEAGRSLYTTLGFKPGREMELELAEAQASFVCHRKRQIDVV